MVCTYYDEKISEGELLCEECKSHQDILKKAESLFRENDYPAYKKAFAIYKDFVTKCPLAFERIKEIASYGIKEAEFFLGIWYEEIDKKKSIEFYTRAAKNGYVAQAFSAKDLLNKADSSFYEAKYEDAISYYEKAIEKAKLCNLTEIVDIANKSILEAKQDFAKYLLNKADSSFYEAKYEDAISYYEKAIQKAKLCNLTEIVDIANKSILEVYKAIAKDLFARAISLFYDKDYKGAIAYYEKAIEKAELYNCAGICKVLEKEWYKLVDENGSAEVQFEIGCIYLKNNNYYMSCLWFEKVARQGNLKLLQKLFCDNKEVFQKLQPLQNLAENGNEQALELFNDLAKIGNKTAIDFLKHLQLEITKMHQQQENFKQLSDNKLSPVRYGSSKGYYVNERLEVCFVDEKMEPSEYKSDSFSPTGIFAQTFRENGQFGSYPLYDSDEEIETDEFDF